MDALPYYKWYWIDYRANRKVQRMSWQARGLYRELLDEFWSEGILPLQTEALADICGCDHPTFLTYWNEISPCWEKTPEGLVNSRMNEQRTAKDFHRVKMAKAGATGAFAKLNQAIASDHQANADEREANAVESLANASKSQNGESSGITTPFSKGLVANANKSQANASKSHIARALARARAGAIAPEAIAKKVQIESGILTDKAFFVLADVAKREQGLGVPDEAIAEAMMAAWADFQTSRPKLQYAWGAEKFFGEGNWKDRAGWPWKDGQAPKVKAVNALDAIRARDEAAEAEIKAERMRSEDGHVR